MSRDREEDCEVEANNDRGYVARLAHRGVEFPAGGRARREPDVAAKRLRQQVVMPLREIVVVDVRVLAEQTLDQIAVIVEKEDNRLQAAAMKLAHFLRGELVGPSPVISTVRRSGAATAAPKAAGVAQPIAPQSV